MYLTAVNCVSLLMPCKLVAVFNNKIATSHDHFRRKQGEILNCIAEREMPRS